MSRRASGLRAWLWQRASAIYMALYVLAAATCLLVRQPLGYESWRAGMAIPLVGVATALFFGALLVHAWVGVRDVLVDYVHPLALRLLLLAAFGLVLAGSGVWMLKILYSLHSGNWQ